MSFGCGQGFGKIFADSVSGEAWSCGEEILFDCLCPGRDWWAKTCAMQKLNKLYLCFLFVYAVRVMLVGWVLGWDRGRGARRFDVD
jgi:hypothetical protein